MHVLDIMHVLHIMHLLRIVHVLRALYSATRSATWRATRRPHTHLAARHSNGQSPQPGDAFSRVPRPQSGLTSSGLILRCRVPSVKYPGPHACFPTLRIIPRCPWLHGLRKGARIACFATLSQQTGQSARYTLRGQQQIVFAQKKPFDCNPRGLLTCSRRLSGCCTSALVDSCRSVVDPLGGSSFCNSAIGLAAGIC